MPETYKVLAAQNKGDKPNPHGGVLYKFYVVLEDNAGAQHGTLEKGVYWQRKNPDLEIGQQVYGHIEDGEYGPRFKTDQRPDGSGSQGSSGGTFNRHFERVPDNSDRSARIERQHSQSAAVAYAGIMQAEGKLPEDFGPEQLRTLIDWFAKDVDR